MLPFLENVDLFFLLLLVVFELIAVVVATVFVVAVALINVVFTSLKAALVCCYCLSLIFLLSSVNILTLF